LSLQSLENGQPILTSFDGIDGVFTAIVSEEDFSGGIDAFILGVD